MNFALADVSVRPKDSTYWLISYIPIARSQQQGQRTRLPFYQLLQFIQCPKSVDNFEFAQNIPGIVIRSSSLVEDGFHSVDEDLAARDRDVKIHGELVVSFVDL